jgi:hypothetical protein
MDWRVLRVCDGGAGGCAPTISQDNWFFLRSTLRVGCGGGGRGVAPMVTVGLAASCSMNTVFPTPECIYSKSGFGKVSECDL